MQNGVHVDGGNPVDIAWGINEVLKDPQRAKIWGENGHSYITHCIFCTSKLTATDISNSIVKHFGMSNNPVFLVTEASGEIKGRLSMGAWDFIKKSTTASTRGWK